MFTGDITPKLGNSTHNTFTVNILKNKYKSFKEN